MLSLTLRKLGKNSKESQHVVLQEIAPRATTVAPPRPASVPTIQQASRDVALSSTPAHSCSPPSGSSGHTTDAVPGRRARSSSPHHHAAVAAISLSQQPPLAPVHRPTARLPLLGNEDTLLDPSLKGLAPVPHQAPKVRRMAPVIGSKTRRGSLVIPSTNLTPISATPAPMSPPPPFPDGRCSKPVYAVPGCPAPDFVELDIPIDPRRESVTDEPGDYFTPGSVASLGPAATISSGHTVQLYAKGPNAEYGYSSSGMFSLPVFHYSHRFSNYILRCATPDPSLAV